jgi:hypothetical protein
LIGRQLSEPDESLDSREFTDADEAQRRRTELSPREPVEVPDQDELIEQIVLEPEDDFVVLGEGRELLVPPFVL